MPRFLFCGNAAFFACGKYNIGILNFCQDSIGAFLFDAKTPKRKDMQKINGAWEYFALCGARQGLRALDLATF